MTSEGVHIGPRRRASMRIKAAWSLFGPAILGNYRQLKKGGAHFRGKVQTSAECDTMSRTKQDVFLQAKELV